MVKAVCTGHCNEAKPMFPITSYLMLAWRTLAKRNSSTLENSSVAFKNVCFIKNCDASISEHELQISILPASGSFEISKDNEIILTGNVKMVENINNLKVSLPHIYTKEHTMTTEDIYENLTKRGYREDSYRCIKSSDLKSETGYIIWNDWLSFLDVMFQFDAIGRNANDFLLPKYIDTIIIDTKAQDTAILRGEDLPIFNHKTMKVIAAGGVQICGTKWEIIHRNLKLQEWQATNCKLETMDETRKELEHAHLEVSRPGDLTSLRWVESESPALLPTPRDEVCQVYYVGLNCQDCVRNPSKKVSPTDN
ncbi:hypothetical protein NE865_08176 [Phthorimaea operculella]|nr:hypothetical protein NE865_08176 [Phthorimaea operculella]